MNLLIDALLVLTYTGFAALNVWIALRVARAEGPLAPIELSQGERHDR